MSRPWSREGGRFQAIKQILGGTNIRESNKWMVDGCWAVLDQAREEAADSQRWPNTVKPSPFVCFTGEEYWAVKIAEALNAADIDTDVETRVVEVPSPPTPAEG